MAKIGDSIKSEKFDNNASSQAAASGDFCLEDTACLRRASTVGESMIPNISAVKSRNGRQGTQKQKFSEEQTNGKKNRSKSEKETGICARFACGTGT